MLARHACYRATPLADPRVHLVPIEAIQLLTDNPEALPAALDGRRCFLEISVILGEQILAQLPARIVRPAGDAISCSAEAFPHYPVKWSEGAFLLVQIVLLDSH